MRRRAASNIINLIPPLIPCFILDIIKTGQLHCSLKTVSNVTSCTQNGFGRVTFVFTYIYNVAQFTNVFAYLKESRLLYNMRSPCNAHINASNRVSIRHEWHHISAGASGKEIELKINRPYSELNTKIVEHSTVSISLPPLPYPVRCVGWSARAHNTMSSIFLYCFYILKVHFG